VPVSIGLGWHYSWILRGVWWEFLTDFRDNISVSSSRLAKSKKTFEDWSDRLSRNVDKELPLYAAYYPRRSDDFFYFSTEGWNHAEINPL